jgi:hypothetical protein
MMSQPAGRAVWKNGSRAIPCAPATIPRNLGLLAEPNAYYDSTLKLSECNVRRVLDAERAYTMHYSGGSALSAGAKTPPYSDPVKET